MEKANKLKPSRGGSGTSALIGDYAIGLNTRMGLREWVSTSKIAGKAVAAGSQFVKHGIPVCR